MLNSRGERIRRLEQRIDELEQKRLDDLSLTVKMWKSLTINRESGDNHDKCQYGERQAMKNDDKIILVVDGQAIHTDHDVTPEQAEKLIDALNKDGDNENIKGWINAVLDDLLDIGEWNAVEVRIQLDNGKGDRVDYEGAYGT